MRAPALAGRWKTLVVEEKKERKGFALSRSPTRVDMYVDNFPGPLIDFEITN
jgi:hypothetical protein